MSIKLITEGFQAPMCQEPVSMAAIGSALTSSTLSTALTIGGGLMSAVGALQQGWAAEASSKYNAARDEQNARITRQETAAKKETQRIADRKAFGRNLANIGGSGRGSDAFSDTMGENAMQRELNILTLENQGILKEQDYLASAGLSRMEGKNQKIAGYIGAGTGIMNTGAKAIYNKKMMA